MGREGKREKRKGRQREGGKDERKGLGGRREESLWIVEMAVLKHKIRGLCFDREALLAHLLAF